MAQTKTLAYNPIQQLRVQVLIVILCINFLYCTKSHDLSLLENIYEESKVEIRLCAFQYPDQGPELQCLLRVKEDLS